MTQIQLSGEPFSSFFTSSLLVMEQKMRHDGYDLEQFSINKSLANFRKFIGATEPSPLYNFTVSVADEKFSIAFTDDMQFFTYFEKLCFSSENVQPLTVTDKMMLLCQRAIHWLNEDMVPKEAEKEEPNHDQHRT